MAEKRWQGGQKSRVNPCKSKLSPASASPCTVARIISFSANPTNLWPAIPAAWKRFRIRPCRSCPPFSRFIMRVKQALYDARFIPTEFFFFFLLPSLCLSVQNNKCFNFIFRVSRGDDNCRVIRRRCVFRDSNEVLSQEICKLQIVFSFSDTSSTFYTFVLYNDVDRYR